MDTLTHAADEAVHGDVSFSARSGGAMVETSPAPAPVSGDGLLALIERIATNPHANLDALDRIVALRERVAAGQAKATFDRDLASMQPSLPTIDARGRIVIEGKDGKKSQDTPYATMADINEAIRPALAKYGFALSFRSSQTTDGEGKGRIVVTGILSHRDGHREEITLPPMLNDSTGSKNNVQGLGSTLSYGRRYATLLLLNISSRAPADMDDNGRASGRHEGAISDEQVGELRKLIVEAKSDEAKLLEAYKVDQLQSLQPVQFKEAVALLRQKIAKATKTTEAQR